MTKPLGLYFHIPFCRVRCRYCGFYSISSVPDGHFLSALEREMEIYSQTFKGVPCDTVYFGGGTPSSLTAGQLARLMESVYSHFQIQPGAEITMEMNPCDMTADYLRAVKAAGVNRLSVGVQARQDRLLRMIGRQHTAKEAEHAVRRAYALGFHNISIDLMYELPTQTVKEFEDSLLWAMHLPVSHLSIYSLILEEGTPFARLAEKGALPRPTEAESWAMYEAMCRIPVHYGFRRYEISSFARNGHESRHNEKYWRLDPYLGMGPSACSRIGRERWKDLPGTRRYEKALLSGEDIPKEVERLSEAEEMEEYCFLHLRMDWGIPLRDFEKRYGAPMIQWYGEKMALLIKEDLLKEQAGRLFLTRKGMALGNLVFEEFLRT